MSNSTKVSVIIPVYNVAEYLPFAMQSCMDQTLRDVEFICVNDGSTDNSLEILNCYAKLDDRITVISKANGGVSSARNFGLSVATGDWIMFLDPDDCLAENACERVWIEGEEGKTDIINFGTEIIPKQPKAPAWHYYALNVQTKRYYDFNPYVLFGEPSAKPFIWHQAYSKGLLDRTGIRFDEELTLGEDMAFLICLYPHAKNFAFIEDKLYKYRFVRNNSAMQVLRKEPIKKMNRHLAVAEKIFAYWKKNGFADKYPNELLSWALDFILHDLENEELPNDEKQRIASELEKIINENQLTITSKALDQRTKSYLKELKAFVKG